MSRGPNLSRRADLERALKRAKPKDEITIDVMAELWGVSKQRFVNVLRDIEKQVDMPAWRLGPRQVHLYPAKAAIAALLAYEKRNDDMTAQLQERAAAILGRGEKRKEAQQEAMLPISELATMSRLMAETEARERQQGLYVPVADVARIAGEVFGLLSDFLSDLPANIDPNGLLPADVRALIAEGGKNAALNVHARMKDMLSGDARPDTPKPARAGAKNGRARRAPARRASGKRVPPKAR